jgi:hypothetical protein
MKIDTMSHSCRMIASDVPIDVEVRADMCAADQLGRLELDDLHFPGYALVTPGLYEILRDAHLHLGVYARYMCTDRRCVRSSDRPSQGTQNAR